MSSIVPLSSPVAAASVSMPTGPPPYFSNQRQQELAIHPIKAGLVDLEFLERVSRESPGRLSRPLRPLRSRARGAASGWRSWECHASGARSRRHLRTQSHAENLGAALQDTDQFVGRVVREVRQHAEAIAQRRGQQTRPRRRADQREARQVDLERARRRSLPDHEVELEVLHRGIEDLFDGGVQAVDLVDEEHVTGFEVRDNRRQIAGPLDDWTRSGAQGRPHLVGDHMRERGLPETGGSVEQRMIQTLAALSAA